MENNRTRYKQMERYMTYGLLIDVALFVLYLLFASLGITWLKVIVAVLAILLSLLILAYLFITRELLRRRSLWMTVASGAIILCTIMSLLLNYPAKNTTSKTNNNSETAYYTTTAHL